MLPGFNRCHGALRFLIFTPAIDTLMKMGLYQQGARRRQLAQTILGQQGFHILATADGVHGELGSLPLLAQTLPYPFPRCLDGFCLRLLAAQCAHRIFEACLQVLFLMLHRLPLANSLNSFLSRARVRCSTTATTAGEVFISPAISRLL